ncbi:hypothetical protein DESC_780328 [Desulfosarcina cetonica]|nr:hypothetical protein [Desulfosarcina cetonica]VTR70140.1 hypothetical protein DESC_780328 [Desulfosarcina cetonica]
MKQDNDLKKKGTIHLTVNGKDYYAVAIAHYEVVDAVHQATQQGDDHE